MNTPTHYNLEDNIELSMFNAWLIFTRLPEAIQHEDKNYVAFKTGRADDLLNMVLNAQLSFDKANTAIEAIKEWFDSGKLPFSWFIGPSSSPSKLGHLLPQHGFILQETLIGMAIDLTHLDYAAFAPPPRFKVIQVDSQKTLKSWVDVLKKAYPISDIMAQSMLEVLINSSPGNAETQNYHYLGILGKEPVATVTLTIQENTASLYDVCTLPEVRHLGLGTILTVTAITEAKKLGLRQALLQATEMGLRMYTRVGFKEYCKFERYIYHPKKI